MQVNINDTNHYELIVYESVSEVQIKIHKT